MSQIQSYTFLFLSGFLFLNTSLNGQTFSSLLVNENGEGIPFANVYLPSASKGTVSDMNGVFSLSLIQASPDSIATISCIGYETKELELRGLLNGTITSITLSDANYELAEATVISSNLDYTKTKVLGNPKRNENITNGYSRDSTASAGMEMGNLMKTKRNWALDKVGFHIRSISRDTAHFEVNIYKAIKGFPGEPINRKRIFLNVDSSMLADSIILDLSDQHIYGKGSFLVTLEVLDQIDSTDYISFPAHLKKSLTRYKAADGSWNKTPLFISVGIWAEVREES